MDETLLPTNATALEAGVAASLRRIQEIPAPIDTTVRPLEVPAAFLSFVGWGRSVDVWSRRWPETRKRAVIDRAIALHRLKGTEAALRAYVAHADGAVLSIERPPMTVFSGPSLTQAEREAWLSGLSQVRVWLIREEGVFGPAKAFHGGYHHALFVERSTAVPSTALTRLHRRARWVVNDVETDVRVTEFGSYFRLHFRAAEGDAVYSGRSFGGRFFIVSTAWRRLVTIQPAARLAWRSPVGPTLEPVTSEPERVKVAGTIGRSVYCGRAMSAGFFVRSTARYRIFDRYPVNDGRHVLRRPAVQFMGVGRYGFPPHTARVRISIPGQRSQFAAGEGVYLPGLRFWVPHDPERVKTVVRALQSVKRLSDRILMDIGPRPRFVAGKPFVAGADNLIVGQP